jgi:hypothetical protein
VRGGNGFFFTFTRVAKFLQLRGQHREWGGEGGFDSSSSMQPRIGYEVGFYVSE